MQDIPPAPNPRDDALADILRANRAYPVFPVPDHQTSELVKGFAKLVSIASGSGVTAKWNWKQVLYDATTGAFVDDATGNGPCNIAPGSADGVGTYGVLFNVLRSDAAPTGLLFLAVGGASTMLKLTGTTVIGGTTTLAGGIYRGRVWSLPTGSLTLTGSTYANTLLGSDPGADNAYFVNLPELGLTTHDLTNMSNGATLVIGIARGRATDGYTVYAGSHTWPGC